jgi:hypothetical protein
MGLFLACSSVVGVGAERVRSAYAEFLAQQTEQARKLCRRCGKEVVLDESNGNTTILYPDGFIQWDEASKFLSSTFRTITFSFHIHDGDLWMFVAFRNGAEVTCFNPLPDYWDAGISAEERKKWAGDASAVSALLADKKAEEFSRYFVPWTEHLEDAEEKAYPDDEYAYGNCWQMVDFMRHCGFRFPEVKQDWAGLRHEVDVAMGKKDFRRAMELLARIAQRTPEDEAKLQECVRRLKPPKGPWWKFW